MRTPSVRLSRMAAMLSVAIVALAPLASTQTVTLGFDGAPEGPLPWSEQGFTFTEGGSEVSTEVGSGALNQAALGQCTGDGLSLVQLVRDDGGTFDAVSLDVVDIFDPGSGSFGCGFTFVWVSSSRGTVFLSEPGTVLLDWTGITELTVEVYASAEFEPFGPCHTCFATVKTDNFVVNSPQGECLLVIGDGPGAATYFDLDHLFETQLDAVEDAHVVLVEDIPQFVLPIQPGRRHVTAAAPLGHGTIAATPVGDVPLDRPPTWMLDGDFAVQVLMWNPEMFPLQPEQFTAGLYVSIQPDGSVVTAPFGTDQGGMAIWHEIDTDAAGQQVIRFPFSITGF